MPRCRTCAGLTVWALPLASALATAGSMVEAKAQIDEILVERPGFTLADAGDMFGYFARDEDREKLLNGMALAGLEP